MGVLIMVLGWVYTVPNIYRSLAPGMFGLSEISPSIYSDATDGTAGLIRMVRKSEENSTRFFGKTPTNPIYIICTTSECDDLFGRLPFGLTMGFHRVVIASVGVEQSVFNHERIHVDLHALTGLTGLYTQTFPAWFDEGLSEYLAGPRRSVIRPTAGDKRAVIAANWFWEWDLLVSDGRYNRHYGAARAVVEDIVDAIGRPALRDIVLSSKTRDEFISRLPKAALNPR